MKEYLLALLLLFTLSAQASGVQPRHRHHPRTEQVDTAAAKRQNAVALAANQQDQDNGEGIEAYSDTTSVDTAADDSFYDAPQSDDDDDDFISFINAFSGENSVAKFIIGILIFICVIAFILSPVIIVGLIIYYLLKRRRQNMQMAMDSMESGEPQPQPVQPDPTPIDKYYLNRGIRNTAIGVGLFLMFAIWDSDFLMGIGALVACFGIGQIVIAKYNKK
jgi:hypothetical protein